MRERERERVIERERERKMVGEGERQGERDRLSWRERVREINGEKIMSVSSSNKTNHSFLFLSHRQGSHHMLLPPANSPLSQVLDKNNYQLHGDFFNFKIVLFKRSNFSGKKELGPYSFLS